jgi:hypothetical protein
MGTIFPFTLLRISYFILPILIIVLRKHKQNIWISQPGVQLAYNICFWLGLFTFASVEKNPNTLLEMWLGVNKKREDWLNPSATDLFLDNKSTVFQWVFVLWGTYWGAQIFSLSTGIVFF